MSTARLTLVSCLFDLAAREGDADRRTPADYFDAGDFIFELDQDLICFADPGLAPEVEARRRAAGLEARTRVVPLALEELPAYRLRERIAAAREANPIHNADPDKDTVLYAILLWSRFELLRRSIALDPFDASHFAWIDLGLSARPHPDDDVFGHPSARVRLMVMRGFDEPDIADRHDYYGYIRGLVAGGYFTGPRDELLRLCDLFEAQAAAELDRELAPTDEQLLPVLALRNPGLFDFHYGDYPALLSNYVRLRGSAENLHFQMAHARAAGRFEHAFLIADKVLDAWEQGWFECEPALFAELLDEAFLAAWYAEGQDAAEPIAQLYARLVEEDPAFRDAFLRDEIRVRSNFAMLPAGSRPWPG